MIVTSAVGPDRREGREFTLREEAWRREAVTSPETTLQAQMGKILGYIKGLHASHLMDVGAKLGLFQRLAACPEGLSPEALAAELGLHPPYVRAWCEAACGLELLDYDPTTGYRPAPFMGELLGRPEATFYVGLFPEAHLLVAEDYARYPEHFHRGSTRSYQEHDEPFFGRVAEALRSLPRIFLQAVLPKLPGLQARLEAGARVLEVGCGGGYAMLEFAERYPGVRCVGIDVEPHSVRLARELIAAWGLADRAEARVVEGADWPAEFAGAFDLVTSFLVVHEIRPDLKSGVIGNCARALRPGGQLLLFDERYASTPAELRDPAVVFSVMAQWYELTWGNVVNTKEEIHALLAENGLQVVDETSLSRFYIVTAERSDSA
jgi:SAM-dependent methyltransferase